MKSLILTDEEAEMVKYMFLFCSCKGVVDDGESFSKWDVDLINKVVKALGDNSQPPLESTDPIEQASWLDSIRLTKTTY